MGGSLQSKHFVFVLKLCVCVRPGGGGGEERESSVLEMGTDNSPTVAGGDESALVRLSCLDGWPDSVLDSALHSTPPSEGAAVQQQGPTSSTLRYQADLEQHQIAGASALVRGRGNVQSAVAFNFLNSRCVGR